MPGNQDEDRTLRALLPHDQHAPIAIIDFLANAESVVHRLGQHTCVADWVLVRRSGEEWVVLASHGMHDLRPGDVLDRPAGAPAYLNELSALWADDVVVDLQTGELEPVRRTGDPVLRGSDHPDHHGRQLDGIMAFPLWGGDGLFGAVCALPQSPEEERALRASEPMVRLTVELLTSVLGLDLDRSRLQRRLDAAESAALSDPLTSLGNRRAFDRALEKEEARCARFGHTAGIMVLDLDGLKVVNDTEGHEAGDELLCRAARTIRSTLRNADQAFRIGGDEFALLLPEVNADGLGALRDRLAAALADAGVSASIGCAIREPSGNLHASARKADAAMYVRKRAKTAAAARGQRPAG